MGTFYLRAHGELSTCRVNGFGLGAIPWTAIVQYGLRAGLNDAMVDTLVLIIRQMDEAYARWHEAEVKRHAKVQEGKASMRGSRETGPAKTPKIVGG